MPTGPQAKNGGSAGALGLIHSTCSFMRNTGHQTERKVPLCMHLNEFIAIFKSQKRPVILLEGIRKVPEADREHLSHFGEQLASLLPNVHFRSGNAPGADQAFAAGVCRVRPPHLQYVAPYSSHRVRARHKGAGVFSLDQLPKSEIATLMGKTLEATPDYAGLVKRYRSQGKWERQTIKLAYLLRDTLKVVGSPALKLKPASLGIFYVDNSNPNSGGTAHTIRVCRLCGVPVLDQNTWVQWELHFS